MISLEKYDIIVKSIAAILIILFAYKVWVFRQNSLTSVTKSSKPSDFVTESNGISTYNGLGITFKFNRINPYSIQPIATTVGNKVYIHPYQDADYPGLERPISDYGYVQVLSKNPRVSFQKGIIKNVLVGYNPNNCPIKVYLPKPGFQEAIIQGTESKCPKEFLGEQGRKYFLMENNHPDKFVFFSREQNIEEVAQYKGGSWQDTLSLN